MHAILNNLIIREPEKVETKTETGIILQKQENRRTTIQVKVESIGSQVISVNVGDTVLISSFAGDNFEYEGNHYRVISEKDIIAVI